MSAYKTVQTSFWTDAKIADDFSIEERYLYLYLFTNPHTNLCGCYEISMKQHIVNETGYTADKIAKLLDRLANEHKVIKYCKETRELLIVNWHKYNWTSSPKFASALKKEIAAVKCPEFRAYLIALFEGEDTVSEIENIQRYGINSPVIVNDNDSVKRKKATAFTPPTVEEVRQYCEERKNGIDAETFVNFYKSKGWKIGKESMKDWQAAVITWEKKRKESQVNTPQPKEEKYGRQYFEELRRKKREENVNGNTADAANMG